ncbi:MAG TPA: hypothetical protein EYP60_08440 [bacterium (Candidatus Stahlbacteria)]|nr:hypothetical protein [Candidatus Stahlbacteria bacterium]
MSTNPGIWVSVIFTLAIYSFLYRDNPIYKIAEHTLVGVSVGYYAALYWHTTIVPKLAIPLIEQGHLFLIVPGALGLAMFFRFIPRLSWLSRYPMAFVIGAGAGLTIPAAIQARIIKQMSATMTPFTSINGVILMIGVLTTLTYFLFSTKRKGVIGVGAKLGIWFMMIAFGATFGYTVMARLSLLIGRIQFLLGDWLGIIK